MGIKSLNELALKMIRVYQGHRKDKEITLCREMEEQELRYIRYVVI